MSLTHPIGDMITRIRNAQNAGNDVVRMPYSALKEHVLNILKEEGFITSVKKIDIGKKKSGVGAIQEIKVISKPGRRAYFEAKKIPPVMNGLGIAIVSTSHGVMTDASARTQNVGGEILCTVI